LTDQLTLPILKDLIPGGFGYGVDLMVEFEPQSIWYDSSLTMAAGALRSGIRTDYHAYAHSPDEIIEALSKFGLDTAKLEEADVLRILDSYSVQVGEKPRKSKAPSHYSVSLDLTDWKYGRREALGRGIDESHKRRLHIDDDASVMLRYNSEAKLLDVWRTKGRPYNKALELAMMIAMPTGVESSSFIGRYELLNDGIIDFKSVEKEGRMQQLVRVRMMRGRNYDTRWHRLGILDNGEVTLLD